MPCVFPQYRILKECFENQGNPGAEKDCFQIQAWSERYIDIRNPVCGNMTENNFSVTMCAYICIYARFVDANIIL